MEGSISTSKVDERMKEIALGEKIGKLVQEPRPRKTDLSGWRVVYPRISP